ncbi:MAG: translesion DNA synthesis-associated protein ImuA [Gammaproteobacteria bacterium]|nr:translesion DNA synthesis-associated protein ImuA [Gammaproteobacteria bacterium]
MADPALEELLRANPAIWRGRHAIHPATPYSPDSTSAPGQTGQVNQADQTNSRDQTRTPGAPLSTGFSLLDNSLPVGGWQIGTLTELLIECDGRGEFSLLLPALRELTQQHWVALVHPPYIPYAPALSNAGVRLDRTLIVDTDNDTDTLWSTEQLLRSGLFAAVVCWVNKTSSKQQRRLQLAAETGQSWAVAYRPAANTREHSPAALRLHLSLQPGAMLINIIKSRGQPPRNLVLPLGDFDASQGVEWPGYEQDVSPDNTSGNTGK